jgi:DHA1 family bicyclomycin/chloramphenicol resistance-like MFS transporter
MADMGNETSPRHPGLGFAGFVMIIACLQAMGAMGVDSMLPNLPAISSTFGLRSENQRQLVIIVYLMGFGLPQVVYGSLADRFGRKPLLLAGIGLYVVFSAVAAFAPSFPLLIAARAIQGMGAAATRSLPAAVVRDCYGGRRMAQVMSLAFMTFMVVPMAAPSLGQAVALFASWRWVFGVLTLFGLFVFGFVLLKLPETLHPEDRTPIRLRPMLHNFAVALRSRQGMGYALATMCISGALFGFVSSVQQVFQDVFKAPALFPAAFALMAGAMAASALVNSRIVGRIGMRRLAHAGVLAFIAISSLHALVALSGHETMIAFALLQAGAMFCFGFMSGNFGAMAMEPLGHVAGAAASMQGTIAMLGGSLIGLVIGQQFNGTAAPIAIGYASCGVLALACILFAERGRLFSPHQGAPGAALEMH